ncbi:MAG TPA: hypothetical protein VKQ30_08740 [Ktedonobacterales bacterium]|nr:hypothetical protein [Ktedonobacterales bacterium]
MRCPRCGAALTEETAVCGRCGNPVAPYGAASASTEPLRTQAGVPVSAYAPSAFGPPVSGDRDITVVTLAEESGETRKVYGYRPVDLPPPLPRRGGGRRRIMVIGAAILAALLIAAAALAHGGVGLSLGALPTGSAPAQPAATTYATATLTCAPRAVNPTAAKLLAHTQLTTGVRDAAKKDYRPVNSVTTFATSQTIYLTFEIVTSHAGSVSAAFCAPGLQALGRLAIPANSAGRYAEFSVAPGDANIGKATATVLWNGAVAASLPFTIRQ